jgi:hypothetical protein
MNARIVKEARIALQVHTDQLGPLGIALNAYLSRPISPALATFANAIRLLSRGTALWTLEVLRPIGLF